MLDLNQHYNLLLGHFDGKIDKSDQQANTKEEAGIGY